jgi:predicted MFS family arabinose efflux permease
MSEFHINPNQFGILVAVYGFAAAIASLCASTVLDRFDRKSALLWLYSGFAISTFLCGIAPTYELLLLARAAAGAFGGVLGATVMAIVGDAFADYRRGTAMGAVMSSFALASIIGLPIGLLLAEKIGLWATFGSLALTSLGILVFARFSMPSLRGHMRSGPKPPEHQFWAIVNDPNHQRAYLFSIVLVMGSFTLIPYLATYMEMNCGQSKADVRWIYLIAGGCTFFSTMLIGRLSDRFGKLIIFRIAAAISIVMCVVITNLPVISLWGAILIATVFMVFASGRNVPAQAMMTACSTPQIRGAFLGVNTALQHFSMGMASIIGSRFLGEVDGHLTGYPLVGGIAAVCGLLGLYVAGRLRPAETPRVELVPETTAA